MFKYRYGGSKAMPPHLKYQSGISIIIPAKNEAKFIGRCIDSLINQSFPGPFEIIAVDNMSTDKTREIAISKGVKVVTSDANSPAAVRNLGASVAIHSILAFIDGDCVAPQNWLKNGYHSLSKHSSIGACGGPCKVPNDANWIVKAWSPEIEDKAEFKKESMLPGANIILPRLIFDSIGGFNEALITAEDDDLCVRIKKKGFDIIWDGRNIVTHHGYPDSLKAVFFKAMWHATYQLSALSFWKNKIAMLTVFWFLSFIITITSLLHGPRFLLYISLFGFILAPALLAFSRTKRLVLFQLFKVFALTYIVSFIVLLGRTSALLSGGCALIQGFLMKNSKILV
jgi:glycosyltransferase involved in cell wall biosynthesis